MRIARLLFLGIRALFAAVNDIMVAEKNETLKFQRLYNGHTYFPTKIFRQNEDDDERPHIQRCGLVRETRWL